MSQVQTRPQAPPAAQATGLAAGHVLLGLLVSLLSTGAFAVVWEQVEDRGHRATAFDFGILAWMHAHQVPWLTALARGLAFLGSPPVIVAVAVLGALTGLAWRRVRGAAWTLPLAVVGAGALIQGIKLEFHRPRPTLYAQLLPETGYSFPSGHSLIAIVVYGLLGYFALHLVHRRASRLAVRALTVLLVALIGVSRPYVQVHYPTDVLAGWTAGLPWLLACVWLHERLARRFAAAGEPVLTKGDSPP